MDRTFGNIIRVTETEVLISFLEYVMIRVINCIVYTLEDFKGSREGYKSSYLLSLPRTRL